MQNVIRLFTNKIRLIFYIFLIGHHADYHLFFICHMELPIIILLCVKDFLMVVSFCKQLNNELLLRDLQI